MSSLVTKKNLDGKITWLEENLGFIYYINIRGQLNPNNQSKQLEYTWEISEKVGRNSKTTRENTTLVSSTILTTSYLDALQNAIDTLNSVNGVNSPWLTLANKTNFIKKLKSLKKLN